MKILTYDHGLALESAITLARAGHDVGYYVPNDDAFPKPTKALIGVGMEGLTRVKDTDWDSAFAKADAVFCPDTRSKKVVDQCKREGKMVWGAGDSERLELDRAWTKEQMRKAGMPVGPYRLIHGIEPLIEYLKKTKDVWVKVSSGEYRGVIETFKHDTWNSTRAQYLGQLLIDFGADSPEIDFIVEEPLEGAEVGGDYWLVRGQRVGTGYGYERKDEAYLGRNNGRLPESLTIVDAGLRTLPGTGEAVTFCSTEVIGRNLIDPTLRAPHPPLAGMLEMYPSWPLLFEQAVQGKPLTVPQPAQQYVAVLVIRSEWATEHWTEIEFPASQRRNVKLAWAYFKDGHYFALPGNSFVAYAVGLGAQPHLACEKAKKVAGEIQCREKVVRQSALDELLEDVVPKGRNSGIPF